MKQAYPIIMTPTSEGGYLVYVPDFDINTQGADIPEAIYMARDAISLVGVDMEDDGETLPDPSPLSAVSADPDATVTLVDVDFAAYRRALDTKAVRRNISLPAWMDDKASEMGLSLSKVVQDALAEKYGVRQ